MIPRRVTEDGKIPQKGVSEKGKDLLLEAFLLMTYKFEHEDYFKPTNKYPDSLQRPLGGAEGVEEGTEEIGWLEWRALGTIG